MSIDRSKLLEAVKKMQEEQNRKMREAMKRKC